MSFYLIDGHSQIYRACYTDGPELTSPSGEPTRGTYYFCRMLFKLARDKQPTYLAMAVDAPKDTYFRKKIYPKYKSNRPPKPEEVYVQRDRIIQIVQDLGIPVIEREGFEADDVIASMVNLCQSELVHTYIVSRDKDLDQLLNSMVSKYDPQVEEVINWRNARDRWDINPGAIADVQALAGDSSDNIPGVKGIGPKGAVELIKKYGSIQGIKSSLSKSLVVASMTEGARGRAVWKAIKNGHLDRMHRLTKLRRDVPLKGVTNRSLEFDGIKLSRVKGTFKELGIRRWAE